MEGFNPEYEKDIKRYLVWFSKKTEYLVDKEEFIEIGLMELRQIFGITDSFVLPEGMTYQDYDAAGYDPYMVYSYEVNEEKAKSLQKYVKHKILLGKYDYFIDARRRES